jgi:hypothetical protein
MDPPWFLLAVYGAWLALLFLWRGPATTHGARILVGLNVAIAGTLWGLMVGWRDLYYSLRIVEALTYVAQAATISLPITLSFWLFGAGAKLSVRTGMARVALATLAGLWMIYLYVKFAIGAAFLPAYYWREYVFMGVVVPALAVLCGYFAFRSHVDIEIHA